MHNQQYDEFPFDHYDWKNPNKEVLGKGSFGVVYKVFDKNCNAYVAIKQMDMKNFDDQFMMVQLKNEIDVMKEFKHENITRLYDSHVGKYYSYMVLELCDSDLRKKMQACGGKLPEKDAIIALTQFMKGFHEIVNHGYIHRDVKPENVLTKGTIDKVADFGFSCKADIRCIKKLDQVCGSPLYMAPQLLCEEPYTAKCDIWSIGIMLYEMIFGYSPWPCRNLESYRDAILHTGLTFPYNGCIGENTKDFIKRCLVVNEAKRIGWDEIFDHPLIADKHEGPQVQKLTVDKNAIEILKRVQQQAATHRINIEQVLVKNKISQLDRKFFESLIRSIDNHISSTQVRILFDAMDESKDGIVSFEEFRKMLTQVDFRDANDQSARIIQEINEIARVRKINLRQLFSEFDTDHSGTISKPEFWTMMRKLLPKINDFDLEKLWKEFDTNNSGDISLKQFMVELGGGIEVGSYQGVDNERARRALLSLKQAISVYNVSINQLISMFDNNNDGTIDINQFRALVAFIDKQIEKEELEIMFHYIDRKQKNGKIDSSQLKDFLLE